MCGWGMGSLIRVHTVCLYAKISLKDLKEYSADDINRRHFQMLVVLALQRLNELLVHKNPTGSHEICLAPLYKKRGKTYLVYSVPFQIKEGFALGLFSGLLHLSIM